MGKMRKLRPWAFGGVDLRDRLEEETQQHPPIVPAPAMIVACSGNYLAGAMADSFADAIVLQSLGQPCGLEDLGTRAAVEYAVAVAGVKEIVVCGHRRCVPGRAGCGLESASGLVALCERWRRDTEIGSLLREAVTIFPLWFDEVLHTVAWYEVPSQERDGNIDRELRAVLRTLRARA